ncbi:hypothetical protein GCM10011588_39150 [Nocardia jinanensis]|uniref:Uncharacterized protein n=1 Tax=Nocardia jinanensis TaxID=382504 RepID=A0A917RQX3_9NOCA|nr:hypothetical protein GCM10011588_39150 [Nocardia jinanensis]
MKSKHNASVHANDPISVELPDAPPIITPPVGRALLRLLLNVHHSRLAVHNETDENRKAA